MANETTKSSTKIIAVLKTDWHYEAPGGGLTVKAGTHFVCDRVTYINSSGDLVLRNWVQYGDASVIPAVHFDLFLEETVVVTTKTVTKKPAKIDGKYVVPAVAEAAE